MQATTTARRRFVTLATALLATLIVGIAYAAWTADGSGTGSAAAGQGQAVTTTAAAATETKLFPGGSAPLVVEVHNPNPYPVKVTRIANRGEGHPITSNDTTCDASHGVTFTDRSGLTQKIGPEASHTFELTDAVSMSNASVDACQGKTFTVPVAITAASDAS